MPVASRNLKTVKVERQVCRKCHHAFKARQGTVGHCPQCKSLDVTTATVKVQGHQCERCEHVWQPRDPSKQLRVCPSCKSPWFDTPRQA